MNTHKIVFKFYKVYFIVGIVWEITDFLFPLSKKHTAQTNLGIFHFVETDNHSI